MDTRLLTVGNRLLAADANGIFLRLDLQIVLVDAGQFDNRDEVVFLLKDVDRRETSDRGRTAPIQSLAMRESRARCRVNNVSNGSLKLANIGFLHGRKRNAGRFAVSTAPLWCRSAQLR
jgi:hypothetical protein